MTRGVNAGLLEGLRQLIDLPQNLIALDLHMAVDEIPRVTCTFDVVCREYGNPPGLKTVTARYNLLEKIEQLPPEDKVSP